METWPWGGPTARQMAGAWPTLVRATTSMRRGVLLQRMRQLVGVHMVHASTTVLLRRLHGCLGVIVGIRWTVRRSRGVRRLLHL